MVFSISLLIKAVASLFCFMAIGFIIKKIKIADDNFSKSLSVFLVYIAQIAMFLHGYIRPFDKDFFTKVILVFILSLCIHLLFFEIAQFLFKNAPEEKRKVLRFGIIFSNAGYMGIPVIDAVFGTEYTIFATIYILWFNIFAFSLGRMMYTGDKKYISLKKAIINPATISLGIGFIIYITGIGGWITDIITVDSFWGQTVNILYDAMTVLKSSVAPISMIIVGTRLADIKPKDALKNKYLYPFLLLRLFLFPIIVWGLLKILSIFSLIDPETLSIMLILSATPAATITVVFAELYDCDSPFAGMLVAVSTLLSVITIPLVSLLTNIQ